MTTHSRLHACLLACLLLGTPGEATEARDSSALDTVSLEKAVRVVVGSRRPQRLEESSRSIAVVREHELRAKHAQSLSDALKGLPGVDLVEQGPSIAKPSIRGMTNQRVVMVRDGVRHEAQQWSNHHTPEMDLSDAQQIEVLKGPGSLLYGSGALGGVVFVRSPRILTLRQGAESLGGCADYSFFSNSSQHALHGCFHGATSRTGWRLDLAGRDAPWYAVPGRRHFLVKQAAGSVTDSIPTDLAGFRNCNIRLLGGFRDTALEVSLSGTQYWERQTLIGEGHWHNSGGPDGGPWYHVGEAIQSPTLHRKIQAHLLRPLDSVQEITLDAAFQQDHRQGIPGSVGVQVDLENRLASGALRWDRGKDGSVRHAAGLSFSHKQDRSYGVEVLIPDHNTSDVGAYYLHSRPFGRFLSLSAGIRGDFRHYDILPSEMTSGFVPVQSVVLRGIRLDSIPSLEVQGQAQAVVPSFSTGLAWRTPLDALTLGLNLGTGFRLPEPNELAILGAHHGSYEYLVGLAIRDPSSGRVSIGSIQDYRESSLSGDVVARWSSRSFDAELSGFCSRLFGYIHARPTGEFVWLSSISALPVKEYTRSEALFYGMEFASRLRLTRALALRTVANVVVGELLEPVEDADEDGKIEPWLPQVAPPRLGATVEWSLPWRIVASYGVDGHFRQSRLAEFENVLRRTSDGRNEEFPSHGYVLHHAGVRWEGDLGHRRAWLSIHAANLLNTRYTSHLSSYKGIAPNPGFDLSAKTGVEF